MAQTGQSMTNDAIERWFLAITQPNKESDAAWHLKRQGFAVFYPRYWHSWSRDGHRTTELRPFFPGYLFAAIVHPWQGVGLIRDTIGVAKVRYEAGEAYQVPRETIWELRRGFDPDGIANPQAAARKHLRDMMRGVKGSVRDDLLAVLDRIDDRGNIRERGKERKFNKRKLADIIGEPVGVAA